MVRGISYHALSPLTVSLGGLLARVFLKGFLLLFLQRPLSSYLNLAPHLLSFVGYLPPLNVLGWLGGFYVRVVQTHLGKPF